MSETPIFAPSNCASIFNHFDNLIQINFNDNFNTSKVTNMCLMFSSCFKIQLEINIMNASIIGYAQMFRNVLSDSSAYVILSYTTDTQTIVETMEVTTSDTYRSKITLKQI